MNLPGNMTQAISKILSKKEVELEFFAHVSGYWNILRDTSSERMPTWKMI